MVHCFVNKQAAKQLLFTEGRHRNSIIGFDESLDPRRRLAPGSEHTSRAFPHLDCIRPLLLLILLRCSFSEQRQGGVEAFSPLPFKFRRRNKESKSSLLPLMSDKVRSMQGVCVIASRKGQLPKSAARKFKQVVGLPIFMTAIFEEASTDVIMDNETALRSNESDNNASRPYVFYSYDTLELGNGTHYSSSAHADVLFYPHVVTETTLQSLSGQVNGASVPSNGIAYVLPPVFNEGNIDRNLPTLPDKPFKQKRQRGYLRFFFRRRDNDLEESNNISATNSIRSIWRHRHARSAEEGIRREKISSSSTSGFSISSNNRKSARRLSSVLAKASASIERTSRRYAARTLTGLITALAEEVEDLDVEVDARDDTPYSNKHIDAVSIKFSRLCFRPLRMGGHDSHKESHPQKQASRNKLHSKFFVDNKLIGFIRGKNDEDSINDEVKMSADEAFDQIDVDKSGTLDRDELIQVLSLAASTSNEGSILSEDIESESNLPILEKLASDLFELYDFNGDGVVDRREYKVMVEDMAALRKTQGRKEEIELDDHQAKDQEGWIATGINFIQNKTGFIATGINFIQNKTGFLANGISLLQNKTGFITTGIDFVQNQTGLISIGIDFVQNKTGFIAVGTDFVQNKTELIAKAGINFVQNSAEWRTWRPESDMSSNLDVSSNLDAWNETASSAPFLGGVMQVNTGEQSEIEDDDVQVFESLEVVESVRKAQGSITFSDVKMDLRRLFFGAVPILKHIVPGGPLILEPFTTTISGSFDREDIMHSNLIDAGLRQLVRRVLRNRVGFLRDFLEGAVFKGRSWKTFGDEGGPRVEIPEVTNVEFDENDKLIISGRVRVRTKPESPVIDQSFKIRTSIGTRKNGRFIRLEEPELALVLECPKSWEKK